MDKKQKRGVISLSCIIALIVAVVLTVNIIALCVPGISNALTVFLGSTSVNVDTAANGLDVRYSKPSMTDAERIAARDTLSEEVAAEGIVMLKNDQNYMPYEEGTTFSLFSHSSVDWLTGGTGSGSGAEGDRNLRSVLTEGGFSINEDLWNFYARGAGSGYERGRGSINYGDGQDFSINEKEGCIYLLCDKEKVFTYTLSGEFISEGKLPFYATAIEFFNDKFCFVCEDDDKGNLIVTDRKYNIESSHFPNKEYGDNMRILVHPFQKTKKGILYRRFLDNNIYRIDSRGEISLLYQINLGTNLLEIDNVKSFTSAELKFEMKYKRCHIKYFTENDNHSIIYFFDKNEPYISVYNKKSKKVKTSLLESVTDDLGHKKLPLLEYVSDQNDFVVILQPTEINDVIPLKENIKESISEDANPILYILHTKSDSYSIKQQ